MSIQKAVKNNVQLNQDSVWMLENHEKFDYSDGAGSEKYLEDVFRSATDLSSTSYELEESIKDWTSEYHLSMQRAQLLSGFDFKRDSRVLEVGCGCGAITRFLAETFDEVVSIEGSASRAKLARLRTKGQDNVEIICAPFQEIEFSGKFDFIFCIGVFEYSSSFVDADDPYDEVLRYFKELLNPAGVVIIAIENQFGLKYLSSSREDHLGLMFEGIEGYHRYPGKVRTFGIEELKDRLHSHFSATAFYFPYPDYKMPVCVLTEDFVNSGKADEMVARIRSRDYTGGDNKELFDEFSATLEIARNRQLGFFAGSFLVAAGDNPGSVMNPDKLGVHYSRGRSRPYATLSTIRQHNEGVSMEKRRRFEGQIDHPLIGLNESDDPWREGLSLNSHAYLISRDVKATLGDIFAPCKAGVEYLQKDSRFDSSGRQMVDGSLFDATWGNLYCSSGTCEFIDREWVFSTDIEFNVVLIRSVYRFIYDNSQIDTGAMCLRTRLTKSLIERIGVVLGVSLKQEDFKKFVDIEAQVYSAVYGTNEKIARKNIELFLFDRKTHAIAQKTFSKSRTVFEKLKDGDRVKRKLAKLVRVR